MKSLWNNKDAKRLETDLDLRVYTSRLLGRESSLVLHGGGNTSVKSTISNLFGETEDILFVKGSGWDLSTIQAEGFAPVKMDMLLKMAELKELDDTSMVKYQRLAMTNPSAPNPSVEAILHAIIPFKFVDHTHADAVVTITNTKDGEKRIKKLYGKRVLVIPYIMPGFILAKLVYDMTKDIDWVGLDGIVLLNHGLFTFDDNPKKSYEKTIELVSMAEDYLKHEKASLKIKNKKPKVSTLQLAKIRKEISNAKGYATISTYNDSKEALHFSQQDIEKISQKGPLTPDHVIRTKRIPAIIGKHYRKDIKDYVRQYKKYFHKNKNDETLLNPAPNFAILPSSGTLSFGKNIKEANIIKDINNHTFEAILKAEKLGGYRALSSKDIFDMEYWELEQAKLDKSANGSEFNGKIAIISCETYERGLAIANLLNKKGSAVAILHTKVNDKIISTKKDIIKIKCDLTSKKDTKKAIDKVVKSFGGIDIVVCDISRGKLHSNLLETTRPFLELGIDPATIVIDSDHNLAPNKEKELYSIAQLVCTMVRKGFIKSELNLELKSMNDILVLHKNI